MQITGKVALVTGAGQGIGKSIALKLASYGADVAVVDVDYDSVTRTALEIQKMGRRSMAMKVDVTDGVKTDEMAEAVFNEFDESIHILVNNAGITRDALVMRMKEEDWDAVINVNLKGVFNCTKSVIKYMTKQRFGRIINIASIVGLMGNAGQVNYAASKAGVIGMTKTVAREVAGRNVTCNAVAPGFIETAMTDAMPKKRRDEMIAGIPLGRLGGPDDVAKATLFLASSAASYITGQVISVNGGLYM